MANKNTLSLMIAEGEKIAAAHKAAPSDANVQAMHDLHENAKQALSREEYAEFWAHVCPKVSGVKDFAGKGWKRNHPDAKASLPTYITAAQEKRKAEKPTQPKAESKPKQTRKTTQPKAESKPEPKAKAPTYTETLLAVVSCIERMDKRLESIDKRLASVEKKLAK